MINSPGEFNDLRKHFPLIFWKNYPRMLMKKNYIFQLVQVMKINHDNRNSRKMFLKFVMSSDF